MDQEDIQIFESKYSLSKYRYVNAIVFLLACSVNSLSVQTFASINNLMQIRFQYSPTLITLTILLAPIMHPFVATPCNMILDRFGVKNGCSLGGVLVMFGAWARLFIKVNQPFWAIFGAILTAFGNTFILSSPSAFALKWFSNQSIQKVIAASVLLNLLSSGLGASIAGFILNQNSSEDQIKKFFLVEAIVISIPFILFIILFKQSPQHPPSIAAANIINLKKEPYIKTIKSLLKNYQYLKIVAAMSLSYGIFISFISILNQSLSILNFSKSQQATSTTLGSAMLAGALSTFLFVIAVKVTLKFKLILCLVLIGGFLNFSLMLLSFCLGNQSTASIAIMASCAGIFVVPLTALFITYSAELTFPVPQASATGYLFAGSQTVGFISGMIWVSILDKTNKWKVYLMYGIHAFCLLLSLFLTYSAQQKLNKTNYQKSMQNTIKHGSLYQQKQQLQKIY